MIIRDRLRAICIARNISLGEIERRAGLPPTYLSELENELMVPPLDILETIACGLDVPLVALFYDGDIAPDLPNVPRRMTADEIAHRTSLGFIEKKPRATNLKER